MAASFPSAEVSADELEASGRAGGRDGRQGTEMAGSSGEIGGWRVEAQKSARVWRGLLPFVSGGFFTMSGAGMGVVGTARHRLWFRLKPNGIVR